MVPCRVGLLFVGVVERLFSASGGVTSTLIAPFKPKLVVLEHAALLETGGRPISS